MGAGIPEPKTVPSASLVTTLLLRALADAGCPRGIREQMTVARDRLEQNRLERAGTLRSSDAEKVTSILARNEHGVLERVVETRQALGAIEPSRYGNRQLVAEDNGVRRWRIGMHPRGTGLGEKAAERALWLEHLEQRTIRFEKGKAQRDEVLTGGCKRRELLPGDRRAVHTLPRRRRDQTSGTKSVSFVKSTVTRRLNLRCGRGAIRRSQTKGRSSGGAGFLCSQPASRKLKSSIHAGTERCPTPRGTDTTGLSRRRSTSCGDCCNRRLRRDASSILVERR